MTTLHIHTTYVFEGENRGNALSLDSVVFISREFDRIAGRYQVVKRRETTLTEGALADGIAKRQWQGDELAFHRTALISLRTRMKEDAAAGESHPAVPTASIPAVTASTLRR